VATVEMDSGHGMAWHGIPPTHEIQASINALIDGDSKMYCTLATELNVVDIHHHHHNRYHAMNYYCYSILLLLLLH